jgi:endonuclease IV
MTVKHTTASLHAASQAGVKKYVLHMGAFSPDRGENRQIAFDNAVDFCERVLKQTWDADTVLCLENDAGSKSGTKCSGPGFLYKLVTKIDSPKLRVCFDSEHAYASGFDLNQVEKLRKLFTVTDVIHLNAVPSYVQFGGHLDRHSDTTIAESPQAAAVLEIAKLGVELKIPMIFERSDLSYYIKDLAYIAESLKDWLVTQPVEI